MVDPFTVQVDCAAVRSDRPIKNVGQRGFARSIWPNQANQFWPPNLKGEAFEYMVPTKAFIQVADGEFHDQAVGLLEDSLVRLATVSAATCARVKYSMIGVINPFL